MHSTHLTCFSSFFKTKYLKLFHQHISKFGLSSTVNAVGLEKRLLSQNKNFKFQIDTSLTTCKLLRTDNKSLLFISHVNGHLMHVFAFISSIMAGIHLSLYRSNLSRPSTSSAPSVYRRSTIVSGMAQNLSYWDSIHSDIDSHLKKAIPIREPVSVFEPMHHLTFAPPKSTASALCVAACELVGGHREDAVVAAAAIHLMHASIYTHEHLLLRERGTPESRIPHKFGPNIELLTGDGFLPFGFELLAGSANPASNNSDKILKVIIEITRAVGAEGMVDHYTGQPSRQLYGCGAACGAILGGGSVEEIERLKSYGVYVGKIQGLLSEEREGEGGNVELAEKWRALALKELKYFNSKKIEQIASLVSLQFSYFREPSVVSC